MKKTKDRRLLRLTFAEGEGVGLWYEYLAKRKLFEQSMLSVRRGLVFGLPQKYGLALDTLLLPVKSLTVVDPRPAKLQSFRKIARQYQGKNPVVHLIRSKLEDFSENGSFDVVVSTEVVQQYRGDRLVSILKKIEAITGKYAFIFVPNAESYAHPKISGLDSYSLDQLKKVIVHQTGFNIVRSGLIDIPPWPSGLTIQSTAKGTFAGKPSPCLRLVNFLAKEIIPFLVRIESAFPLVIKKHQAHLVYLMLKK